MLFILSDIFWNKNQSAVNWYKYKTIFLLFSNKLNETQITRGETLGVVI